MTECLLNIVRSSVTLTGWPALLCLCAFFSVNPLRAQEELDFAHDVLPILVNRCAECHADGVFQAGLSIETRQSLIDADVVAIGDHSESELWLRVTTADDDLRMPPQGPPLTEQQKQALARWIDVGLPWPDELSLAKSSFSRPLTLRSPNLVIRPTDDHPVDMLVADYFQKHDIDFPEPLSDRQFIRRLKLDLLGLLPEPAEVALFVADPDPRKDQRLVDEFLSRSRNYADHWISFWNDLLRNDYAGTGYIDGGRQQITNWLHQSLLGNKPFDQFTQELIQPLPPAAGFSRGIQWRGELNASQIPPLQFSQNVSQVFLGINMKCASCHDSFVDNWKLSDAYGLAAVVSDQPLEMFRCDIPIGQTATSKFVFPELGDIDQELSQPERLQQLAALITSPHNGRFSRTIVNRLWQRLAGRGLVHPVDRMANQAWSEDLLDFLATELVGPAADELSRKPRYDLKHILRLIATSRIYRCQPVASQPPSANLAFRFQGVGLKRMTAEQFVDSVWTVTNAWPQSMAADIGQPATTESSSDGPSIRAGLVVADLLMRSLGRPNREQVVTTRPTELSTLQALDLSNGQLMAKWIRQGAEYWLQRRDQEGWSNEQLLQELFETALSRQPNAGEWELLQFDDSGALQPQLEDLLWMILMLPEFQLIH